jgi:hypothetical protein
MISVKGGNILRIGDELSWEVDGCKIKLGGYDAAGGKVIISNDDWYMGQKDGYIYHNRKQLFRIPKEEEGIVHDSKKVDKLWDKIKDKVNYEINEKSDIIDINGDKYLDQMMINMILIEKIKQLEAKLAKTQT